jgi:transposase-like protein
MNRTDKTRKAQLLQEWQGSTERKADFAARHGIGLHTFYNWTRKLQGSSLARNARAGFRAIPIEEHIVVASRPVAVIHYPSGIRLEFHELPDPMVVKALIH